MDQPQTIDKTEELRRGGLYLGPVILGSVVANSVYRVACEARSFTIVSGEQPSVLNLPFLVLSVFLAWRVPEPVGRLAFVVMAVQQALLSYAAISTAAPNRVVVGALWVVFAALITASGARFGRKQRVVIASTVFVAMFLFSWGARYYADVVLGRRSVLRPSPICWIQGNEFAAS
jgi:hypothetical protein